jgi:hypothetical protein
MIFKGLCGNLDIFRICVGMSLPQCELHEFERFALKKYLLVFNINVSLYVQSTDNHFCTRLYYTYIKNSFTVCQQDVFALLVPNC